MDNKKIGNFILERRKLFGLTQQQLADQLGISNKAISKWETGEGYPDISTIPELCKSLSISTDDFFEGEIKSYTNGSFPIKKEGEYNVDKLKLVKEKCENIWKKSNLFPYFICSLFVYYIIPVFIDCFCNWQVEWMLLTIVPVICVVCGIIYTFQNKFTIIFAASAAVLFLPARFVYLSENTTEVLIFSALYGISALLGSCITAYLKKQYTFVVIKKENIALENHLENESAQINMSAKYNN